MNDRPFASGCPCPVTDYKQVTLAHGSGGELMHRLINDIFAAAFASSGLESAHDAAVIDVPAERLAFTTDSYVVDPLEFPGGDIGTLAINGTVNDLAMSGARPLAISCGFIIEEGFSVERLWRLAVSMQRAALAAGVPIVTGDTKVVERGHGHGLYINTSGIGSVKHRQLVHPNQVAPGDVVILSGDIGRHGLAVLAGRRHLSFESTIQSDCAPVHEPVLGLFDAGLTVHCLRDLTRGGLAAALVEIARSSTHDFIIDETALMINDDVRAACELLGFDPLHIANEGCFIAIVPSPDADRAMTVMRRHQISSRAAVIGRVTEEKNRTVIMKSGLGTKRVITLPAGELLPRIC